MLGYFIGATLPSSPPLPLPAISRWRQPDSGEGIPLGFLALAITNPQGKQGRACVCALAVSSSFRRLSNRLTNAQVTNRRCADRPESSIPVGY
jgi:hypothetical protein